MKIAITAQYKNLDSPIDLRFGRAKWLIVIDTETNHFKAHDNNVNLNIAQGAGIQTAQNVANSGAKAVITGNAGPNAFRTLNAAGVGIFLSEQKSVQQTIDDFKAGKLKKIDKANVEGHWI